MSGKEEEVKYEKKTVEYQFNKPGNKLPFAYMHPGLDGRLVWFCDKDQYGHITSIFRMTHENGHSDKKAEYLNNLDHAIYVRDELIKDGWIKYLPPECNLYFPDENGNEKKLNRKQKRHLQRKMKKMQKQNPMFSK